MRYPRSLRTMPLNSPAYATYLEDSAALAAGAGSSGHNSQGGRLFFTTFSILSLCPEDGGLRVLEQ